MPTLRGNGCDMAFVERGASAPSLLAHCVTGLPIAEE